MASSRPAVNRLSPTDDGEARDRPHRPPVSLDPPLPADLAAAVARAGIDPTADRRSVRDGLRRAIADRGGYVDWGYDDAGWVVFLLHPEREAFHGATLQEAPAWSLVQLMIEDFAPAI